MKNTVLMLATAALLAASLTVAPRRARAQDSIALDFTSLGTGSNYHQGAYCLGWRFTANKDCLVSELGFYDASADGLTSSHQVGIFDVLTKALVASGTVVPADPLTGFFRYHAITPVQLTAGRDYYAVADVGPESYAINVPNLIIDPAITFVGFACNYQTQPTTTLDYPDSESPGTHGDWGPSFKLRPVASVTPTPGPTPTPTPTPTPVPSTTPTPTPTPTPAPTPAPGATPTPTPPPTNPTSPPVAGDLSIVIISPPVDAPIAAGSSLPVAVAVTDGPGYIVTEVNYFVDGSYVATTGAAGPFFIRITAPAAGSHLLQASARDSGGRNAAASYQLTTYAAGSPPPNVASVSGLDNRNVNAGDTITAVQSATASAGSTINSVTFYADSTAYPGEAVDVRAQPGVTQKDALFGDGSRFYRALIPILARAIGSDLHVFAVATDSAGVSQVSDVETLHVKDPAADPSAVVKLNLGGVTNVTIGKPVQLSAKITDADGAAPATPIVRLEYLVNGVTAQDSSDPFAAFTFAPTSADDYLLSVIATDEKGISSFGDPVLATAAAPPVITVTVKGNGRAVEGGAPAKVIVTRTGDASAKLKVPYKVSSSGGAVNGIDYTRLSGKVVFPAGQASVKLKARALDDSLPHDPRNLKIKLLPSTDGSYTLGDPAKAKLQLIDND